MWRVERKCSDDKGRGMGSYTVWSVESKRSDDKGNRRLILRSVEWRGVMEKEKRGEDYSCGVLRGTGVMTKEVEE